MRLGSWLTPLAAVTFLVACGSERAQVPSPGASTASAKSAPAATFGSAGSCAVDFNVSTLRERTWAFDGTLVSLGVSDDSHLGQVPSATFTVNRWYKGGAGDNATVQYETGTGSELAPASAVGTRMLVAGEPRWGGKPLDNPVAWGCGFTTPWTEASERSWMESFASGSDAADGSDAAVPMLRVGEDLRPGEPRRFDLSIHCGVRVLSWLFNGQGWKTDQADAGADRVPEGWPKPSMTGGIVVTLELSADSKTLVVTYAGAAVEYHPAELLPTDHCA